MELVLNFQWFLISFVFQFILGQLWYGLLFRDLVKKFLIEAKRWPIDFRTFSMFNALARTVIGNYIVIFIVQQLLSLLPAGSDLQTQLTLTTTLAGLTAAVSLHHSGWEGRSIASIIFHESFHVLYFAAIPAAGWVVSEYISPALSAF